MKKLCAFTLMLVLLASLCATGFAVPSRASENTALAQIDLIFKSFDTCRQNETEGTWFYAVTDLDHNGRLELLAASVQGANCIPAAKFWEVSMDGRTLEPGRLNIADGETFVNILTDSAETRYDPGNDSWYYLVTSYYPVSSDEAYLDKSAVFLKSGVLDYGVLATEHVSGASSSYMGPDGKTITEEDFRCIGDRVFENSQQTSTHFEWFKADDAKKVDVFTYSYAVFTGNLAPSEAFVAAVPYPAGFLAVTKNPTSELLSPGDTALFVANANAYTSLEWIFVAPEGTEYSLNNFAALYPASPVSGGSSTTLRIDNVSTDMSGWNVYCIFRSGSRAVCTTLAGLYVYNSYVIEDPDTFFFTWFYDGSWVCPVCSSICYGDYCPYCGFNAWDAWYQYYDEDDYLAWQYAAMLSQYDPDEYSDMLNQYSDMLSQYDPDEYSDMLNQYNDMLSQYDPDEYNNMLNQYSDMLNQYDQNDMQNQYDQNDMQNQYDQNDMQDQYDQNDMQNQYDQNDMQNQYDQNDMQDQYDQNDMQDQYDTGDTESQDSDDYSSDMFSQYDVDNDNDDDDDDYSYYHRKNWY